MRITIELRERCKVNKTPHLVVLQEIVQNIMILTLNLRGTSYTNFLLSMYWYVVELLCKVQPSNQSGQNVKYSPFLPR